MRCRITCRAPDLAVVRTTDTLLHFYVPRPHSACGPYRIGVINSGFKVGWGSVVPRLERGLPTGVSAPLRADARD